MRSAKESLARDGADEKYDGDGELVGEVECGGEGEEEDGRVEARENGRPQELEGRHLRRGVMGYG